MSIKEKREAKYDSTSLIKKRKLSQIKESLKLNCKKRRIAFNREMKGRE